LVNPDIPGPIQTMDGWWNGQEKLTAKYGIQ
jgi:hypothetical protein